MLQIVLFVAGLITLIKGKIRVSNDKEIVKPYSYFLGIFLIVWAVLVSFLELGMPYDVIMFVVPVLVTISFSFTGRKIDFSQEDGRKNKKRTTIIAIVLLAIIAIALFFAYYLTKDPRVSELPMPREGFFDDIN